MNHRIRKAEIQNLQDLAVLLAEHAAFEGSVIEMTGKSDCLRAALFGETRRIECLVVVDERDALLGYATFGKQFSTWDAAEYMHLDCLFLRPKARNAGIGKRLLRRVAQRAREEDCFEMQWQTPVSNVLGLKFYLRLGATKKDKFRLFADRETIDELASEEK
ncbi:MAG: GNAT family N-acetyltransferase [Acidobacteria bacterium]|nr:GNAT family N-acetyltransferase [Acidobacteriota bacterium]